MGRCYREQTETFWRNASSLCNSKTVGLCALSLLTRHEKARRNDWKKPSAESSQQEALSSYRKALNYPMKPYSEEKKCFFHESPSGFFFN